MENNINFFVKPIIMRKHKFDIKSWIEYKRVIKKCKKTSPSFDDLCEIYDFLTIIRKSYMYGNSLDFHLFIGSIPKGYTKNNSCSIFYKDNGFNIGFILLRDTRTINIEITRNGQSKKDDRELISFVDGEYKFKDIYDQEKFLFITSCLMDGLCELISYYYKNKRF